MGSMLPQIAWGLDNGFSVIVFNPNMSRNESSRHLITYCYNMAEHCEYVWANYLDKHHAKNLAIIAHSAGGRCVASLFSKRCKI